MPRSLLAFAFAFGFSNAQNLQNFKWEEDDVNRKLDRKMTDAFAAIWDVHKVCAYVMCSVCACVCNVRAWCTVRARVRAATSAWCAKLPQPPEPRAPSSQTAALVRADPAPRAARPHCHTRLPCKL